MDNNTNDFERIEKTLADIRAEAENFRWEKDTVASAVEILRDRRQTLFVHRRKLWQSLAIFLLICNLTQGLLLMRSRKNIVRPGTPAEKIAAVIPVIEPPAAEVKRSIPQKHADTEIFATVNKEPDITAEEGLNQLLGLYKLFETLSPEIILPAAANNARLPVRSET
ncbi:MAG: hypothetical protein JW957_04705 [Candidatus Omnitrophica bacterium]|nr:hypothetical protein [Candidatus Omnitrophota bacterium]